ncbi:hypothetical protein [Peribacillus simplex]|uniref:hypothetical protein n=1 Tax=Peribacillus simplex TaxID=1478 RepID=UPI0037C5A1FE
MEDKRSDIGVSGLMNENDKQFNLVPEGLKRMHRRENYVTNPEHASLKNQLEKRDLFKEKRFQAQQKNTPKEDEYHGECPWCEKGKLASVKGTVYWELIRSNLKQTKYSELMNMKRLLKRNYFDF